MAFLPHSPMLRRLGGALLLLGAVAATAVSASAEEPSCAASAPADSRCPPAERPGESLLLQVSSPAVARSSAQEGQASMCPAHDFDFSGADLPYGQFDAATFTDCQALCKVRPECQFFTFYKRRCYLKSSDAGGRQKAGAISGSRSCSPAFVAKERPDLAAIFAAVDGGYQGADSGASVRLSDETYLWLWGDTLIGRTLANGEMRTIPHMTRQSVAKVDMMESQPGVPDISALQPRHWQPVGEAQFFPGKWYPIYWFIEGATGQKTGALFLQIWHITHGLSGHARTMLVVDDPSVDPDRWTFREGTIPANESCNYAHGMVQMEDWVYMLGECNSQAVVARGTEEAIHGLRLDELQYWSGQEWSADSNNQAPLFHMHWSSEASLRWNEKHRMWYVPLLQSIDPTLRLATAPELTGPWSVQEVYNIPSKWGPSQNRTAYAAKSHPELASSPDSLIISYNTNLVVNEHGNWQQFGSENHGMANASVYRIQFVELQVESVISEAAAEKAVAKAARAVPPPQLAAQMRGEQDALSVDDQPPMRSGLWRTMSSAARAGSGKAAPGDMSVKASAIGPHGKAAPADASVPAASVRTA